MRVCLGTVNVCRWIDLRRKSLGRLTKFTLYDPKGWLNEPYQGTSFLNGWGEGSAWECGVVGRVELPVWCSVQAESLVCFLQVCCLGLNQMESQLGNSGSGSCSGVKAHKPNVDANAATNALDGNAATLYSSAERRFPTWQARRLRRLLCFGFYEHG